MRLKTVIANRKIHGNTPENKNFLDELLEGTRNLDNAEYIICLPHPYYFQVQSILKGTHIHWGGQTMSRCESGTHEIIKADFR